MSPYSPLPGQRTFVRRYPESYTRDPTSGHRLPVWTQCNIDGVLSERAGNVPSFSVGVVMTQDAVFYTRDTLDTHDQIIDDDKTFEVLEIGEKRDEAEVLVYRACHLHILKLYKED